MRTKTHRRYYLWIIAIPVALQIQSVNAARCDCSSNGWISGCTATVMRDGEGVRVTSSSTQCSRVDWYLGQSPQVSVFWGGKEWESVPGQSRSSPISIESCRVCKDEKTDDSAARTPRQVSGSPSSCDAFLERMAEIGTSVNVQNAEASMNAMTTLCGSVDACMQKMQACINE
jgi:hypothetical protein